MTTPPKWPERMERDEISPHRLTGNFNPAYVTALESALARAREALKGWIDATQSLDDGDDVRAMLAYGEALDNARACLAEIGEWNQPG